ncbi:hypothetical protein FBQ96_17035 [Nitrospirales bacterium NOB]|nr:hypothetical protein [Nitrospirales bacterium NOB]
MADFPYTSVAGKLKTFLDKIPETGVPAKLTQQELAARGFKSTNDRTILSVLKALALVGTEGSPTAHWQSYRDRSTNRALLAQLIRTAYADLFAVYPDADRKSDADIRNFMSSKTKAGERAILYMVQTFKALAGMADFGAAPVEVASQEAGPSGANVAQRHVPSKGGMPQVHVNLQIHLTDMDDEKKIDAVFRSMAEHIFGKEREA